MNEKLWEKKTKRAETLDRKKEEEIESQSGTTQKQESTVKEARSFVPTNERVRAGGKQQRQSRVEQKGQ